jgi:LPXTG-site transpeptidase (sortase) family protein
VLIIAGVIGLALLAVGYSTVVEEPVANDQIQDVTPVTEPTSQPGDGSVGAQASSDAATPPAQATAEPVLDGGPALLDDTFVDNRMSWPDNPGSTAWITHPGYQLVPRQPGQFVAIRAPMPQPPTNVVVEAAFRKMGGPPGGGYGLIVRDQAVSAGDGVAQGGRYYVLEVSDQGRVGIWRREQDRWIDVLPWTDSPAVRQGQELNTLQVWAVGQRLSLFVNGVQAASQIDGTLPTGSVGVFVGGDGNQVQLEHFVVRDAANEARGGMPAAGDQSVSLQQQATPTPDPSTAAADSFRPVTRVVIPSIKLDAPAVPADLVKDSGAITWAVPPFKVGHAQDTGGAGGPGNAVLVGHVSSRSVGNVFEQLHDVHAGDDITIFSNDQRFSYRVSDVRTVQRSDVSVVQPTTTPALTLITCTGVWLPVVNDYAQRVIVRAELTASP